MKLNLLTESEFNDYISSGEYVYESELFYSVDFDSLYSLSYINAPVVYDFIYIMVIDEDLLVSSVLIRYKTYESIKIYSKFEIINHEKLIVLLVNERSYNKYSGCMFENFSIKNIRRTLKLPKIYNTKNIIKSTHLSEQFRKLSSGTISFTLLFNNTEYKMTSLIAVFTKDSSLILDDQGNGDYLPNKELIMVHLLNCMDYEGF